MKRLLTHTMTGLTLSMLTHVTFAQESNTMVTPSHLANVTQSSFSTQPFENNVLNAGNYTMERVSFDSHGTQVIGNLLRPAGEPRATIIVIGPVAFVKEQ